jgi:amino acid adenylation domain-containing protein
MLPMAVLPRLPYKENFYFRGISKMSLLGRSVELPAPRKEPVTVQFTECVELKPEIGEPMERLLDYWRPRLSNAPTLELPTDRPRSSVPSFRGETQLFSLPPELVAGLKDLSRRENVTLFMTLAAAFQVLLQRYSGQDDIVIGTPATSSSRSDRGSLRDLSADTLVLRTDLSGNPSFRELLAQVWEVTLGAYAHQDLPFDKLVEALSLPRDRSRNPLFQVMFIVRSVANDKLQFNEITPELLKTHTETAQFDLILDLSETPQGWKGSLGYAADLFEAATITRLIGHFQTLLEGIVARPEARLSELPLLTETERRQLLVEWNDTQADYPKDKCIHQLFEEQVARTPDAIALVFEDQKMSYCDLNRRANQLAHYLQTQDVQAQTLVAIGVDRSLIMIISLLGILKAGGTYVPIDPNYPAARLAYLLDDCQAKILITQSHIVWPETSVQIINVDNLTEQLAEYSSINPKSESSLVAGNLAYVIYTSGSTGNPKGVMVSHANVSRLFATTQPKFNFNDQDVWTLFHSYAFDFSVWEMWGALLYGGKLIIVSYITSRSPEQFYQLIVKEDVTVLNQTPSAFRQLLQVDQTIEDKNSLKLRYIIFGGEALDISSLSPWFKKHGDQAPQLINMYGITETTVHVTYHALTMADALSQKSVIGTALPDLQTYILDKNLQPQAIGIPGELYVAGAGLARGYLNRSELTAEKFIRNPFCDKPNARLYKTGDLVRWLPDGNIEYLGRIDQQIQLRGFRIELGEIESVLGQHPQLREVVLSIYEPVPGDKRLVAYLVAHGDAAPALSELQDFLKPQLPEFMIPSAFVFLDELPLTPNGKLDRNALPMPDMNRQELDVDFIAPRSQVEKELAEIWRDVLRINRVGIHDNFFDLGGQSLLATQVITRVSGQLSVEIPLARLFEMPTIADLAKLIENTRASAPSDSSRIIPQRRSAYKTGIQ